MLAGEVDFYTVQMTAIMMMTMYRLRLPALCMAALLCLTTAEAAPLWKWRDANGRVQISDRPPPKEVPDSAIIQRPDAAATINYSPAAVPPGHVTPVGRGRGASTAAESAPAVDPELEKRRSQMQAEAAKQPPSAPAKADPQAAAQRAESCRRAQNLLAALQSGQRMARAGAQGEREVLDDKARAEEVQRAQAQILSHCN